MRPSSPAGAGVYTAGIVALLWIIVAIDAVLNHRLLRFGITPRTVHGLPGIVFAPFLHESAAQLGAITIPLAAFAWLLLISGPRYLVIVTIAVVLITGLADWTLGPSHSVLVGASSTVFGWFGYVLARAWFSRNLKSIAIAVIAGAVFSSLFTGLLPKVGSSVFWGAHLAGFVVGAGTAAVLHRRRRDDRPGLLGRAGRAGRADRPSSPGRPAPEA